MATLQNVTDTHCLNYVLYHPVLLSGIFEALGSNDS